MLLLGDSLFILIHVALGLTGLLPTAFLLNVEQDGGIPEIFNYLKWTACILGCLWLFQQMRERLYLFWALVFLYLLLDDSFSIHEVVGAQLAFSMKWQSAFALRAIDFGEMAVMLLAAVAVLAPVAVAYLLSADEVAKAFSRNLMLWLVAFAVFGCGIDMLHIMVSNWSGVYAAMAQ